MTALEEFLDTYDMNIVKNCQFSAAASFRSNVWLTEMEILKHWPLNMWQYFCSVQNSGAYWIL